MTASIDICNRALSAIGTRSTIASLTESSNEAAQCNLLYGPARDQVLRAAHWDFARKTATLTLLKAAPGTPEFTGTAPSVWNNTLPAAPWLYSYAYPSDCMAARFVQPQIDNTMPGGVPLTSAPSGGLTPYWGGPPVRFAVATDTDANGNQGTVILTDQDQALLVYTMQITDPSLFDALFTEALVLGLASKLVVPLTGNLNLAKEKASEANALILQARVSNGNEGLTVNDHQPDWMRIRGWSNSFVGTGYFLFPYGPLFGG